MITHAYWTLLTQPPPVVYRPFCSIARVSRINHFLFTSLMHWSPPQNTFCSPLLVQCIFTILSIIPSIFITTCLGAAIPPPPSAIPPSTSHSFHSQPHRPLPWDPQPGLPWPPLWGCHRQISCLTRFAEEWQGRQRKEGALECPVSIPLMTCICCACTAHTLVS